MFPSGPTGPNPEQMLEAINSMLSENESRTSIEEKKLAAFTLASNEETTPYKQAIYEAMRTESDYNLEVLRNQATILYRQRDELKSLTSQASTNLFLPSRKPGRIF